jgi:hypothetical protein
LGGIFYLINVGIALGLYGDFTQPLQPGIDLPIWDFLTIVARGLLRRRQRADPIWLLLRNLAGPRRAPGEDCVCPPEWPTRRDWFSGLVSSARTYLRKNLDVNQKVSLGELVCAHAARVELGPVYLDVHLSLEDLPIAIRMAGLDRDPGWVPSAGRHVAFHFD